MSEKTTQVLLTLPEALLARMDALLRQQHAGERPPPPHLWLHQTTEGREWWHKHHRMTHLSTQEMQAMIKAAWEAATGGVSVGRPRLREQRDELMIAALEAHLAEAAKHPPAPPRWKVMLTPLEEAAARRKALIEKTQ